MKNLIFITIFSLAIIFQIYSQEYLEKTLASPQSPDVLVTLSASVTFNQAINLLSKVSEKTTGQKIVSTVQIDSAIGVELKNMNYFKALTVLTKMAGLIYEEKPDLIVIKRPAATEVIRTKDNYVPPNSREIKISAIFFEADVNKERQLGINWQNIFNNGTSGIIGTLNGFTPANSTTGSSTTPTITPGFNVNATSSYSIGGFSGQVSAVLQAFDNDVVGDIISSPNVTVLDGTQARLQDGQDIDIKQKDFSGNIIDNFYATGSIVLVTPHIIKEDNLNYIFLTVHVERSSFVPNSTTTIIDKTSADTKILMIDGEETVIGGMYIDQITTTREGIPFLKDLPWWFFGLRYLFGYNDNLVVKKELVILIKTSLVPTIKERLSGRQADTPLKDELQKEREKIKFYQIQQQSNER